MTDALLPEPTEDEIETTRQADAMKEQLRKDVASWSAGRDDASSLRVPDAPAAPARPASVRPSRAKAKAAEPAKPPAVKAPFKMSYDGTTERDYIAHIVRLNSSSR